MCSKKVKNSPKLAQVRVSYPLQVLTYSEYYVNERITFQTEKKTSKTQNQPKISKDHRINVFHTVIYYLVFHSIIFKYFL